MQYKGCCALFVSTGFQAIYGLSKLCTGALSQQFDLIIFSILGALTKLRKATISFVMAVCPSARIEQLASTGQIFMKHDL